MYRRTVSAPFVFNIKNRMRWVGLFILLAPLVILLRLFYLQTFMHEEFSNKAERAIYNYLAEDRVRGKILDVNGRPLAESVRTHSCGISKRYVKDKEKVISFLATTLDIPRKRIEEKWNRTKNFFFVAKKIKPDKYIELADFLRTPAGQGLELTPEYERIHPYGESALDIIGAANSKNFGLSGIEQMFNKELSQDISKKRVKRARRGQIIYDRKLKEDVSVANVYLTIDEIVQYYAETALKKAVADVGAERGVALVQEPSTGKILAAASYPVNDGQSLAFQFTYEPGSTFKTIGISAALDSGTVGITDSIPMDGRKWEVAKGVVVKDNQHEQNIVYSYGLKVKYKNLLVSMNADNYDRYSKSEINTDNRSLIYTNDIYNPKIQYTFDRLKNNLFNFGADLLFDRLYSDRFTYNVYESKKQWLASIFVQDDWDVTDKINIVLGARLDEHKEYGLNAAPKASIKYDLTPFTLRFNYSNGYRCPTLKELYMFWDHQGMFTIVGSKDLRPEKNNYFSLSTEYVSSIIYCNVLAYANLFTNKIDGIWTNDETVYLYSNIGKTELYGVDLNTKIKIVKDLFFYGNVNYLIKQHNSAVAANIISPLCLSGRLEYKKNLSFADLVVNLSSTYRSGKDYSVLDDNDEEYFVHIDDYVITNSSVSCVFQNKYRITLGINNIFDYTAPIVSFNSTNTPGRRMFCAFNVDF